MTKPNEKIEYQAFCDSCGKLIPINDEMIEIKNALIDLVELENYKDNYGKTEYYKTKQPEVWGKAKAALVKICLKQYQ